MPANCRHLNKPCKTSRRIKKPRQRPRQVPVYNKRWLVLVLPIPLAEENRLHGDKEQLMKGTTDQESLSVQWDPRGVGQVEGEDADEEEYLAVEAVMTVSEMRRLESPLDKNASVSKRRRHHTTDGGTTGMEVEEEEVEGDRGAEIHRLAGPT